MSLRSQSKGKRSKPF